jgi:3-oxoacyl-[acyl-carrier-protein] synthase II
LAGGERGFRPITLFDVSEHKCRIAAEVPDFRIADVVPRDSATLWSRAEALGYAAAREALGNARLDQGNPALGLIVGSTNAWMYEAEQLIFSGNDDRSAAFARHMVAHPVCRIGDQLAAAVGGVFRKATVCSACSSGALAAVLGAAWLRLGLADKVLVGAADSLCMLTHAGFGGLGALSPEPCQPFDVQRAGMSLGEGAGFLVLERELDAHARGADILAWLSGWAVGAEAHHITQPETSGETATRLMKRALSCAGVEPNDIDYINAHGTATLANDAMEAAAIHACLGPETGRVWVSSSKGQLGHTLGAAGAVEAIVSVLSLMHGVVPPTGGLVTPDSTTALRHVINRGVAATVRGVLSNSFGFGGSGVVLLFEHPASEPKSHSRGAFPQKVVVSAMSQWTVETPSIAGLAPRDAVSTLDPDRSRRFDLFSALVTGGANNVLTASGFDPGSTGLVVGSCYPNVTRVHQFLERVRSRGHRPASPAEFPHIVPSSSAGNASVYLGLKGPAFVVLDDRRTSESALDLAFCLVQSRVADSLLVGTAAMNDPAVTQAVASCYPELAPQFGSEATAWIAIESAHNAKRRGSSPFAEIVVSAVLHNEPGATLPIDAPCNPTQSRIVSMGGQECLATALRGSTWENVPRLAVAQTAGTHEISGMDAFLAATVILRKGAVQEVLVCRVTEESVAVIQLRASPLGAPGELASSLSPSRTT